MRKGFEDGACPFCNVDREFNTIEFEDAYVMAWCVPKELLRPELLLHMLIVPKRHKPRFLTDLTDKEVLSVRNAAQYMCSKHNYKGGMLHLREGDMRLNAGTVPHLHFNYYQPNESGEVRIPVYKDPKDTEANAFRAAEFARMWDSGVKPANE